MATVQVHKEEVTVVGNMGNPRTSGLPPWFQSSNRVLALPLRLYLQGQRCEGTSMKRVYETRRVFCECVSVDKSFSQPDMLEPTVCKKNSNLNSLYHPPHHQKADADFQATFFLHQSIRRVVWRQDAIHRPVNRPSCDVTGTVMGQRRNKGT